MVRKALLVFVLLSALSFTQTSNAHAFELDFFGLRGAVEELVNGPKQEVEEAKTPSIFQQFFSWVGSIWKKGNVFPPTSSPTPTPVKNPFPQPSRSPETEPTLPEERSTLPQDEGGPISKGSISGKWLGRYDTTTPSFCADEDGAWEANLTEQNGKVSGSFKSDMGAGGSVSGSSSGNKTTWDIGGSSGVSFKGVISGSTVSGGFTGPICDKEEAPQPTKGSFFGGRL